MGSGKGPPAAAAESACRTDAPERLFQAGLRITLSL